MRNLIMTEELGLEIKKLWIIDVDGTLTDSGIYYDNLGNELKKFCTRDAAGFFALHALGAETMILTGRESRATEKRMTELHATYVFQGIKNKRDFLDAFLKNEKTSVLSYSDIAYIGDDLNDYPVMNLCGYKACPADGCEEIKLIADYVSSIKGGYGAVRDVVEHYLKENGVWATIIDELYGVGK